MLQFFGTGRSNKGRPLSLSPIDEFFIVLVSLHLSLLEQDVAYHFGISQPTVSWIFATWINFLYLQFLLWPPKELIDAYVPNSFKQQYPSTGVIIDASEVFIQQPSLPELQHTFSTYKNHNTYKGLVGIAQSGAMTFMSKLYPGSISDKELTRQSGLLNLLQYGDSIMADRGFDIMEDLAPHGGPCTTWSEVKYSSFSSWKGQIGYWRTLRRIASLWIHMERCMERIKNFHIFDGVMLLSMMDISNQIFFVCAVLTNFHPPLCS